MEIPAAVALMRLASLTAAACEPVLDAVALSGILEDAARPDADGTPPWAQGWVETYDLNAAAAAGWRMKQALAASAITVAMDGATHSRAELTANAERMARHYEARAVSYGGHTLRTSDVVGNA